VAIAPRGYDGRYANRLLHVAALAFDASPEAHAAADTAAELALAADAELRVIAVVAEPMNGERSYLEREVAALVEGFPPAVKAEWRVIEGDPAATLADETAEGVDLLVIGSRAFGPVGRVFLGSVASRVVHSASCPVLVVPRRHAEAA
jgi:nucleotide-binding universal stress UspA family protein